VEPNPSRARPDRDNAGRGLSALSRSRRVGWATLVVGVPTIAAAAAGCLPAGDYLPSGYSTPAYLVNMTLDPQEVRLFRARGPLDCGALGMQPARALELPVDPYRCAVLKGGYVLPLAWTWSIFHTGGGMPEPGSTGAEPACDAVVVRAPGLPDTLLSWQKLESVKADDPLNFLDELDDHAVYLERAGARLLAAGTRLITAMPATVVVPDLACPDFPNKVEAAAR
jgi:hypothetical protein